MSDQSKLPRRLTAILNDPSAEFSEIISAAKARAKAQGGGAVTNHALVKSLSSTRKLDDHTAAEQAMNNNSAESSHEEGRAAKDNSARSGSGDDKLMPLGNINRRASMSSQSSSRRSLFRHEALRRQSIRRRASLESIGKHSSSSSRSRSSRRSTCSGRSINVSQAFNCSTNSINMMDFGVSNHALSAALDESRRSFSSLDEDVLDELDEELYGDEEGRGGSRRGLLLSWRKNDSSRSLRSIRSGDVDEQPTRSEGDLDDYQDSCGFMDWPSVADGANDTIQEEHDPIKTAEGEEWNIEDYEQNIDDSARSSQRRPTFLSQSLTKSLQIFDRSPSMESSFSTPRLGSSFSSQEGITDLIKQKLLNTKNKLAAEVDENIIDKKKPNGFSFTSALRRSSSDAVSDETTNKSQEAIWVRESDDDPGVGEQYRNIYAPAATKSPQQTQRKSMFSYF